MEFLIAFIVVFAFWFIVCGGIISGHINRGNLREVEINGHKVLVDKYGTT